jgi:HSP20 family protein
MRSLMWVSPDRSYRIRPYEPLGFNGGGRMPVDVHADDEGYVILALVPGLKADDLHIEIEEDVLRLWGEIQPQDEQGRLLLRELQLGKLERSLRLPDAVDAAKAEAKLENGMLTLRLPKAEAARAKVIKVKAR